MEIHGLEPNKLKEFKDVLSQRKLEIQRRKLIEEIPMGWPNVGITDGIGEEYEGNVLFAREYDGDGELKYTLIVDVASKPIIPNGSIGMIGYILSQSCRFRVEPAQQTLHLSTKNKNLKFKFQNPVGLNSLATCLKLVAEIQDNLEVEEGDRGTSDEPSSTNGI